MTTLDTPTPTFDHDTAEAFLNRVASLIDAGAVASMMSIGHRTKLFDTARRCSPWLLVLPHDPMNVWFVARA